MTKRVHYDLIMQYAKDWAETPRPWERWEQRASGRKEWIDLGEDHPSWAINVEYRRKQKTRTVNGFTFEWEPADKECDVYYLPSVAGITYFSACLVGNGDTLLMALERQIASKTPEQAIALAKAMIGEDPNE